MMMTAYVISVTDSPVVETAREVSLRCIRDSIYTCRLHRKDAVARKDWEREIFAERLLNQCRKKYRTLRLGHE